MREQRDDTYIVEVRERVAEGDYSSVGNANVKVENLHVEDVDIGRG
jgi:hypothetical protein